MFQQIFIYFEFFEPAKLRIFETLTERLNSFITKLEVIGFDTKIGAFTFNDVER